MCRTLENASRELGSKIKQILFFCLRIIFNAFISLNDAAQTSGGVNVHTHTVSAPMPFQLQTIKHLVLGKQIHYSGRLSGWQMGNSGLSKSILLRAFMLSCYLNNSLQC